MKLSLAWLGDHLDTDATLDQIVERLTMIGHEVESVLDRRAQLKPFIVGQVLAAEPHPNADRLRLCTVDTGAGHFQVVCGAPNARAGIKGVFAPIGAVIPGTGVTLEKKPIRGIVGAGMLCSEREMGLSDEHEGIIELPEETPIGASYAEIAGLDDPVIDVAITPNRGDCLGVLGLARDLAAAGLGRLITKPVEPVAGRGDSPIGVRLDLPAGASEACGHFVGRHIGGVRNRASPPWLQRRLRAVGLRPISALVDVTNFVTIDRARPLHVFDADSLAGGIHVRLARAGETLAALNDKTYTLDDGMTVIADDDGAVGLAGVIGGTSTGCTFDTVNLFLELAVFDPRRTARTGRMLAIESDARFRFERGVDLAGAAAGAELATRMILDLCGGTPSHLVEAGSAPIGRRTLRFRTTRVHKLGGLDLAETETETILRALGFENRAGGDGLEVSVPTWRNDVEGEADLVEEVLRIKGYDAIPAVAGLRQRAVAAPALGREQRRPRLARRALAGRGFNECVTWSFLSADQAALFGGGDRALTLDNPISAELTTMRPSLLPNLIAAAARNGARGHADMALFEVGPIYRDDSPAGQVSAAAGIRRGATGPRHWLEPPRPVDAFDAKADALAVLALLGAPTDKVQIAAEAPNWFHPGRAGTIRLGPKAVLGWFGEIHPKVLARFDLAAPLIAAELMLDALPRAKPQTPRPPLALVDLPPVARDFAFVLDERIPAEQLLAAVRAVSGKPPHRIAFAEVSLFDTYVGEGVPAGKKSLAVGVVLQPVEQTLTEADIQAAADAIVAQVAKATGGVLRG